VGEPIWEKNDTFPVNMLYNMIVTMTFENRKKNLLKCLPCTRRSFYELVRASVHALRKGGGRGGVYFFPTCVLALICNAQRAGIRCTHIHTHTHTHILRTETAEITVLYVHTHTLCLSHTDTHRYTSESCVSNARRSARENGSECARER